MPIGTAVHARTFALAHRLSYREWSGYYAVCASETHHEHEYNAIRNAAALIDISPLFKYLIRGRDASKLVDRVITRDTRRLAAEHRHGPSKPMLKKLIALATVDAPHAGEGTVLEFEVTVEAVRHRVAATVVRTPFFNPPRQTQPLA